MKITILGLISLFVLFSVNEFYYSIMLSSNFTLNNELNNIQSSRTETYTNILWNKNPTFLSPADDWYSTINGDSSDAELFITPDQANYEIIGESYEEQVLLNNDTKDDWVAFNKSDLVLVPQRTDISGPYYGVDDEGAWCTHRWWEGESGGQPKNTPEMHWKKNISLNEDMSDYIITSVNFDAIINGTVDTYIDTPGDTLARGGVSINQYEKYDFVQFYVEISSIDIGDIPREEAELNTYRIAFNQTRLLGNEGLSLYTIEGLIGEYGDQAIIDALTNVLANDPGNNDFCVVLGIYIYCEDNNSGTDLDDWTDLRFKNLNLTFNYVKKINQGTEVSWKQDLNAINGSNVQILDANLRFKYSLNSNWTQESENSRFLIYINDRRCEPPIYLSDYEFNPEFINARPGGFDITSKLLPYETFTLEIQIYLAENFGLDQNYTISIDDVFLYITYTEIFPDLIEEPLIFAGLFILALAAAVLIGGYAIAYQFYLKYPVPVRKVRKYRKTLTQEKEPGVSVTPSDSSFKKIYQQELSKSSKFLKSTPANGKLLKSKIDETKPISKIK